MTGYILGIVLCLLLSAFFSSASVAFSSANRLRIESAQENGARAGAVKGALSVLDHLDFALAALTACNNLANVSAATLAVALSYELAGDESWTWLAGVITAVLVLVLGETMPEMVARKNANRFALRFSLPVRALALLFSPMVFILGGLAKLLVLPLRGERAGSDDDAAVEELQSIIETAEDEDVLDEGRSELLRSALDFSEISASEAMTARVDVVAIDIEDDWEDILETIANTTHSRLPVYEGSIDSVIGFLYLNHFLKAMTESERPDIRSLLMEPLYIYKTIKLPQVLTELRHAKKHLAIVTDEYGGTLGVISMEDVLEQIVGDIWDETDVVEHEVVERSEGEYELDGDMSIWDFLELAGIPEEDFDFESDTVGGWTMEMFGRYPKAGDSFEYENVRVTVLKMDGLRVDRVNVKLLTQPGGE